MHKGGLFYLILIIFSFFFVSLAYADDVFSGEIKQVAHYSEEYESGNINYAQLIVYISELQKSSGRIFDKNSSRAQQLKDLLGPSTEETFWVWNQDEQRQVFLEKPLEGWRKLIFDGNKIQLWLNAWPSIRGNNTEKIYYDLHIDIQFKNKRELENLDSKIASITALAGKANQSENFENELAKESVDVERAIGNYINSNPAQCSALMEKYLGSPRDSQDTVLREYVLGKGKYGLAKARLEYCENCQNSWISINVYREYRGGYAEDQGQDYPAQDYNEFKAWSLEMIKEELQKSIKEYAESADDAKIDRKIESRINALSNALNERGNDVWKEVDKEFNERRNSFADEERKNYDWQAENKRREERAKELQKTWSSNLRAFYDGIFSAYSFKETRFKQANYEKKLLSAFKEIRPEICSNGIDDNSNSLADCSDPVCNQQKCGESVEGNESRQMFCQQGKCEVSKEPEKAKQAKCESKFEEIKCDGKVIFRGQDKNGCPFEPICLPNEQKCSVNQDCLQPLCGLAECVSGFCKVSNLNECRQKECNPGDKKTQQCSGQEINIEICEEGLWKKTGAVCSQPGEIKEENKDFLGNECKAKEDCSAENSVCSNGKCIILPKFAEEIKSEPVSLPETPESPNEKILENQEQEESVAINQENPEGIVNSLILSLNKIVGFIINGDEAQNETSNETSISNNETMSAQDKSLSNSSINESEKQSNESTDSQRNEADKIPARNNQEKEPARIEVNSNNQANMNNQPPEPQKIEESGFGIWGGCKVSQERSEGYLSFNGFGRQFERYQRIKENYYKQSGNWCKDELLSLVAQRKELESSLNNDFAKWFFEGYVANTAEGWESKTSAIYEVYWKDVELSRRIAESMKCLGIKDLPEYNLISLDYNASYGSLSFWEEEKTAQIDDKSPALPLISPYMKVWLLPPKDFIKAELKKAMEQQRFPGPENEESDRDADEGPSSEDRKILQEDKSFMNRLRKITDKYGGNINASVQLKDGEDLVFNLYARINEQEIMRMKPMPPELMPSKEITIILDFNKIYSLVEEQERESRSDRIESPPWDKKRSENKIRDIKEAITIFFKIQAIITDAEIIPKTARTDVNSLIKAFLWKMISGSNDN